MKTYKVIKEFGSAKKGDLLTYDNASSLYLLDITEEGNCRFMAMDEDTAEGFVNDGYLLCLNACNECNKLKKIGLFITDLINQYTEDHQAILDKYNEQEIPTCVKVEADTVHFNLIKVLNRIQDIINE